MDPFTYNISVKTARHGVGRSWAWLFGWTSIDKMSNICSKTGTTCIVNVRRLKTKLNLKNQKPIKPRKTAVSELFRELSLKVLAFSRAEIWPF